MSVNNRDEGAASGHYLFLMSIGVLIFGVLYVGHVLRDRAANLGSETASTSCTQSHDLPTPPPVPSPTSPSVSKLARDESNQLRYYALRLINDDRAAHGLPPVVLGINIAAQLHAEDMLVNDYYGHWWADGRKPYMVYTQTGGRSYISENVATSGWTDHEWTANGCDYVRCVVPTPKEEITDHQWSMKATVPGDQGWLCPVRGMRWALMCCWTTAEASSSAATLAGAPVSVENRTGDGTKFAAPALGWNCKPGPPLFHATLMVFREQFVNNTYRLW